MSKNSKLRRINNSKRLALDNSDIEKTRVKEANRAIFSQLREECGRMKLSNSENFDKSILSLSSAALGISLIFLKDFVPVGDVTYIDLLFCSWIIFGSAIIFTIASYIFSQIAIDRHINNSEKYYIDDLDDYFNRINPYDIIVKVLNRLSGVLFVVGIILTLIFVTTNINNLRSEKLTEKNQKNEAKVEATGAAELSKNIKKVTSTDQGTNLNSNSPTPVGKNLQKGAELSTMPPKVTATNQPKPDTSGNNSKSTADKKE